MSDKYVYVFCGKFETIEQARLYSEQCWEPEPDESASEEEYSLWEDRNPTHELKKNIDSYLDGDFIETVDMDVKYLSNYVSKEGVEEINKYLSDENILVLVFEDALGGFPLKREPVSTEQLTYCGKYTSRL